VPPTPPPPTKILVVSHSAELYSGNAEVVRNILLGLLANYSGQYHIRQVGLRPISAVTSVPWEIIPTKRSPSPAGLVLAPSDLDGEETLREILSSWLPDLVFIHNDPLPAFRQIMAVSGRVPVLAYLSIDGAPLPDVLRGLPAKVSFATMSQFSKQAFCALNGLRAANCHVVCAPADTGRFEPVEPAVKMALRRENRPLDGMEGVFILGWVGRNQWRKQLWINFQIISLLRTGRYRRCALCGTAQALKESGKFCPTCGSASFSPAQPIGDIVLWIHLPTGREKGDWVLEELERAYGLRAGTDILYSDDCAANSHIAVSDMPLLYQMWDALLYLSGGEGFGLPSLEAMACGLPVVYSNYSSHGEWLSAAQGGLGISGILQPEPPHAIMRQISDVYQAVGAVLKLYEDRELGRQFGANGRAFAERHDMDRIAARWHDIIQECIGRFS
jgi:glycosyltransferase involved in cell wall biosynthesis